jgi:hypothetical protein
MTERESYARFKVKFSRKFEDDELLSDEHRDEHGMPRVCCRAVSRSSCPRPTGVSPILFAPGVISILRRQGPRRRLTAVANRRKQDYIGLHKLNATCCAAWGISLLIRPHRRFAHRSPSRRRGSSGWITDLVGRRETLVDPHRVLVAERRRHSGARPAAQVEREAGLDGRGFGRFVM